MLHAPQLFYQISHHQTLFFYFSVTWQLHDEFNKMLMNLVFAESIMAAYGIPVDFAASILHGWKLGRYMCYTTGFLLTFSGEYLRNNDKIRFFKSNLKL